jgi:hypothetical protein
MDQPALWRADGHAKQGCCDARTGDFGRKTWLPDREGPGIRAVTKTIRIG